MGKKFPIGERQMSTHPDTMSENANIEDATSDPTAQGDPGGGSGLGATPCPRWSVLDYGNHWLINSEGGSIEAWGISKEQAEAVAQVMNQSENDQGLPPAANNQTGLDI